MSFLRKIIFLLLLAAAWPASVLAQVDINSANARTLAESLTGIGLVKAEAIIAYRNQNGPFRGVDELVKVKGIGRKTLDANRGLIVVAPGETTSPAGQDSQWAGPG